MFIIRQQSGIPPVFGSTFATLYHCAIALVGVVWIYIVQFKLYRTVNELYRQAVRKEPLVVWWIFVPGLNLIVGFREIHFLSQFWAKEQGIALKDAYAEKIPLLSANSLP